MTAIPEGPSPLKSDRAETKKEKRLTTSEKNLIDNAIKDVLKLIKGELTEDEIVKKLPSIVTDNGIDNFALADFFVRKVKDSIKLKNKEIIGAKVSKAVIDIMTEDNIVKEINTVKDPATKIKHLKIILQNKKLADSIIENLKNLKLEDLSLGERLELAKLIVKRGDKAASALAENLQILGTIDITNKDTRKKLAELIGLIANQGFVPTSTLFTNFKKLQLQEASLTERLDFVKLIAKQGDMAANVLVKNFDKFQLQKASGKEILDLAILITIQGTWAGSYLAENLQILGPLDITIKDTRNKLAELIGLIAKQGFVADNTFAKDLDKFRLQDLSLEERLDFAILIAKQGNEVAETLAKNLQILGPIDITNKDTQKKLAELIGLIAKQRSYKAVIALANNFDKFPLQDLSLEELFDFAKLIVNQGDYATYVLVQNLNKFRLQDLSLKERFEFAILIASQGNEAAFTLVQNLNKFRLQDLSLKERFELAKLIASQGKWAAFTLLQNLNKFLLQDLSLKELFEFAKLIASQGNEAAYLLAKNLKILGTIDITNKDTRKKLAELIGLIANQGGKATDAISDNLGQFRLQDLSLKERYEFAILIASQGNEAAYAIVLNFRMLQLQKTPLEGRFELAKLIASQGDEAGFALVLYFDKFQLQDIPPADQLKLVKLIANQGSRCVLKIALSTRQFSVSEDEQFQIFLEAASFPHEGIYTLGLSKDCIKKYGTIINILIQDTKWELEKPIIEDFVARYLDLKTFIDNAEKAIENVKDEKSKLLVRSQLYRFLAYTAGVLESTSEKKEIIDPGLISDILTFRTPPIRYRLLRALSQLNKKQLNQLNSATGSSKIPAIFLVSLVSESKFNEYLPLMTSRIFKDTKNQKILVDFLYDLKEKEITEEEAEKLLDSVIIEKELIFKGNITWKNEMDLDKLSAIANFLGIFGSKRTREVLKEEKPDFSSAFQNDFAKIFNIKTSDTTRKFNETFKQFRNPKAIFTYYKKLNEISPTDRDATQEKLSIYVTRVLERTYQKELYNTDNNPHLQTIFEKFPEIKAKWIEAPPKQTILESTGGKKEVEEFNFFEFFKTKILTDTHLDPAKFPFLKKYLEGENSTSLESELEKALENEREKDKKNILQLQMKIIDLCKEGSDKVDLLKSIEELVPSDAVTFRRDLNAAKNKLKAPVKVGKYTIEETDDPCDRMESATEIQGSCQNYNDDPEHNKCLLSHLLDGKNKIIVVKGAEGKIVARSILKLLWDERNQKPVLFQERTYNNVMDKTVDEAIDQWTRERAKMLGLTLTGKECGSGEPYTGSIESLRGPVPFEYSDAAGGVIDQQIYEIKGAHVLI